jgi:hypothetical protein
VERAGGRAIDHLVLPVTTLMLARSRLTTLGFTVAPDARHPFGTGNCCVFFRNQSYVEPITILDRATTDRAAADGLVFVRRIKRFTERQGEGFAMVALTSTDAEADHAHFRAAGIAAGEVYRFVRTATLADGSEREIGVALAYADFPRAPDASIFACQHLAKDVLFQPHYLEHPNGALGVTRVVAVAEQPDQFRPLLDGIGNAETSEGEVTLALGGQSLEVLTPEAFRTRYGMDAPNPRRGMLFAAFELLVEDKGKAERFAGKAAIRQERRIVIPAAPGLGTVVAFIEGAWS